jgi:hypothetical protein
MTAQIRRIPPLAVRTRRSRSARPGCDARAGRGRRGGGSRPRTCDRHGNRSAAAVRAGAAPARPSRSTRHGRQRASARRSCGVPTPGKPRHTSRPSPASRPTCRPAIYPSRTCLHALGRSSTDGSASTRRSLRRADRIRRRGHWSALADADAVEFTSGSSTPIPGRRCPTGAHRRADSHRQQPGPLPPRGGRPVWGSNDGAPRAATPLPRPRQSAGPVEPLTPCGSRQARRCSSL